MDTHEAQRASFDDYVRNTILPTQPARSRLRCARGSAYGGPCIFILALDVQMTLFMWTSLAILAEWTFIWCSSQSPSDIASPPQMRSGQERAHAGELGSQAAASEHLAALGGSPFAGLALSHPGLLPVALNLCSHCTAFNHSMFVFALETLRPWLEMLDLRTFVFLPPLGPAAGHEHAPAALFAIARCAFRRWGGPLPVGTSADIALPRVASRARRAMLWRP